MGSTKRPSKFHVAMYPWFAFGHISPFLHLSNKLAERGHSISFFLPTKVQQKMEPFNLHPNLITFIPLVVPHVEGLPSGAETTADVPIQKLNLILQAMDGTRDQLKSALENLKPDIIFFDISHWVPALASQLGIKSIYYSIIGVAATGHIYVPARKPNKAKQTTLEELMQPPSGYPGKLVQLHLHEARAQIYNLLEFGRVESLYDRLTTSMSECDAISFRTCREIDGPYCDYIQSQYGQSVLLAGPVMPEPRHSPLEDRWAKFLSSFRKGSVVYCAFGSECMMQKGQFQELLLGLELTGLPFLVAMKPPHGVLTIKEALPEGFEERVGMRGVVYGSWVQQPLILGHPSVGCFISHCGFSSLIESLMNDCQIVLVPNVGDQFVNSRIMSGELKVAVEVERREEDGWYSRESLCNAVKMVMDHDSEVGKKVWANKTKWRDLLANEDMNSYIDGFIQKLQDLWV